MNDPVPSSLLSNHKFEFDKMSADKGLCPTGNLLRRIFQAMPLLTSYLSLSLKQKTLFNGLVIFISFITGTVVEKSNYNSLEESVKRLVAVLERLVVQDKIGRINLVTTQIHSLLHIIDDMRSLGLPCNYWCFVMTRYVGHVKHAATINRHIVISLPNNRL